MAYFHQPQDLLKLERSGRRALHGLNRCLKVVSVDISDDDDFSLIERRLFHSAALVN